MIIFITNSSFYWTKYVNYFSKNIDTNEVSYLKRNNPCWDVELVCAKKSYIKIDKRKG
jgi:hypothetical protein